MHDITSIGIIDSIKNVLENGISVSNTIEHKNKIIKFTLSAISDNTGTIKGCVALIQDISELEKLEQMRKDFIANVSHEFRTPLTIIRGSLEALIDEAVNDQYEVKRYLSRILSETKGLERLVKDLLDLSKLKSGKIEVKFEDIYIDALLSDVVRNIQIIANAKNISIHYMPSSVIPAVFGDYDRLRQLFIVFLDNAVKYSFENSSVEIKIWHDNMVHIEIKDEGSGIPAKDLPFIWDRFYKVDKSRSNNDNSTGLGLAIAKQLIELHNGTVTAESSADKGTKFIINLPIKKSE